MFTEWQHVQGPVSVFSMNRCLPRDADPILSKTAEADESVSAIWKQWLTSFACEQQRTYSNRQH